MQPVLVRLVGLRDDAGQAGLCSWAWSVVLGRAVQPVLVRLVGLRDDAGQLAAKAAKRSRVCGSPLTSRVVTTEERHAWKSSAILDQGPIKAISSHI